MKNYTFLFLTIILFSCTSVEVQEFNDNELKIDENVIFLEYLENDWQKNLNQNLKQEKLFCLILKIYIWPLC